MTDASPDFDALFADLCTQVGICLHPKAEAKVKAALERGLDAAVRAVFEAEGIDEPSATGDLRRAVRDCIKSHVSVKRA